MSRVWSFVTIVAVLATTSAFAQTPIDGAFTYQGQLKDQGQPASGPYDMQFRLYAADAGGMPLATYPPGGPMAVTVQDGLFTAITDFGTATFNGERRWLEIVVEGVTLTPRQELTVTPYALYALHGPSSEGGWLLTGNGGTTPGTDFLGTTDNEPLIFKVNGGRVIRLEPTASIPNVIAGAESNEVTAGVVGAAIGGGGSSGANTNRVTANFGTVAGGAGNRAGEGAGPAEGDYATVGGGQDNVASGDDAAVSGGLSNHASGDWSAVPGGWGNAAGGNYSFAGGLKAQVRDPAQVGDADGDEGSFVWADASDPNNYFTSTGPNQFLIRAAGGVGIGTANPEFTVDVRDDRAGLRLSTDDYRWGSTIQLRNFTPDPIFLGEIRVRDADYLSGWNVVVQPTFTTIYTSDQGGGQSTFLRLDDQGHVGINNSLPTEALSVAGVIESTAGGFKFPDDSVQTTAGLAGSGTSGCLPKFTGTKSLGNSVLYEVAGKIGLNDSMPEAALDINGTSFSETLWLRGPGGVWDDGRIRFQDAYADVYIENDIDGGLLLHVNDALGGRLAVMDGNVGIGTLEPDNALSVAGDADFTGAVGIGTPTPVNDLDVEGGVAIGAGYSGTSAAPANGLIVEGNVGIGTSTPTARLDVASPSTSIPSIVTRGGADYATVAGQVMTFGHWDGTTYQQRIRIDGSGVILLGPDGGNVGIGLMDASEKLDTSGTARLRGIGTSTGTTVVADANGKLWKQSSSLRYKHNLADLPSAGDAVLDLRPVAFEWNSTGESDIGLIAEEVEHVLPDLVICDAAGRPDGVRYDKVALYLMGVVKDQREQIGAQQAQIKAQQDELSKLQARLEKIEALLAGHATQPTGGVR